MQATQVENTQVIGSGWAPYERKGILRALQRIKLSPAAAPSGSGTYVTASDSRSAHASLNVEGTLEATSSWLRRVGLALVVFAYMTRLVIQRMHIVG